MDTDTILKTVAEIHHRVTSERHKIYAEVSPVGYFHATDSRSERHGKCKFLFRYGDPLARSGRLWAIEFTDTKVICMRGGLKDMDNLEELLSDLAKFRMFHG